MKKKKRPFSHIRIVFRRTSPLVKCVVLVLVVVSIAALIALRVAIRNENQNQAKLQQQAADLTLENKALTQSIAQLGTVESVKRIAELELGLVDPNSQFFVPEN